MEEGIKGFDYRSTIRDPKTGKLIKEQHYKIHESDKGHFLERDGKFYFADGSETTDPRIAKKESTIIVENKDVSFSKK